MDRSAVMRDAHKRYRQGQRLNMGWTFAQCLSTAWQAAKMRQAAVIQFHAAPRHKRADKPFPIAA